MAKKPGHIEEPGPNELRDPLIRAEMKRAAVWIGMAAAVALVWVLAYPLLLIVGGIVFGAMLDGGTRLLGRVLPIGRVWRLLIVVLAVTAFMAWVAVFGGSQLIEQAENLRLVVMDQFNRISRYALSQGVRIDPKQATDIGREMLGTVGPVASAVTSLVGAIASIVAIVVVGVFLAVEPRLYERGVAWMLPMGARREYYTVIEEMGATLRRLMAGRLLAMLIEGVGTWWLLSLGDVPMAPLLGILTGLFALIPNIGALISGSLLILVGFSAGLDTGLWAVGVYLVVHFIDGYLIVPMVARRSVDLAPAVVLGAQLLMGALFGILGLALADPIVAMARVALERRSEKTAEAAESTSGLLLPRR
jgi:predicted PurR-regulated permease PerM